MATYVTDGKGNAYKRKYDSKSKTYKDHYVGSTKKYKVTTGNPDKGSSYKPSTSKSKPSSSGSSKKSTGSSRGHSSSSRSSSSKSKGSIDMVWSAHPVKKTTPKKTSTYGYTNTGEKIAVDIIDGLSYLAGTKTRVKDGTTVETAGGIYKLSNGKGVKVRSHNRKKDAQTVVFAEAKKGDLLYDSDLVETVVGSAISLTSDKGVKATSFSEGMVDFAENVPESVVDVGVAVAGGIETIGKKIDGFKWGAIALGGLALLVMVDNLTD